MRIKGYAATALMAARTHDYFGLANLLGNYLIKLIRLAAMIYIWRSLFAQGADTGGMTLEQVLTYTYMGAVLEPLLDVRTPASSWLHEGGIVSNFMRPQGLFTQLTLHTVGSWAQPMLLFALPALMIAPLIGINVLPATPLALVSLALTVSEGFAVDYLFACLLIRMKNMSWTIHSLRGALSALLTGAVIPFALLPWDLGRYLEYTPFGTLAGAALAVYAGAGDTAMIITMQIVWNIVLWPAACLCFNRSRERIISYGG
ncbi:MAG: hypothetical protein ACI4L8_05490 [Candidatus Fimadaptatus sp.]